VATQNYGGLALGSWSGASVSGKKKKKKKKKKKRKPVASMGVHASQEHIHAFSEVYIQTY
jgi:hypothetical protein